MKYEVIRDCMIKGSRHRVGEVIELDGDMAKQMMAIGRVSPSDQTVVEDRSIGLGEDKPKRRGRPKKVEEPKIFDLMEDEDVGRDD